MKIALFGLRPGEGAFGNVKLVLHKPSGRAFALKCQGKRAIVDNELQVRKRTAALRADFAADESRARLPAKKGVGGMKKKHTTPNTGLEVSRGQSTCTYRGPKEYDYQRTLATSH